MNRTTTVERIAIAVRRIANGGRSLPLALAVCGLCGLCGRVYAGQSAQASGSAGPRAPARTRETTKLQEVVVTGTLLKGTAPVGATIITLDQSALEATGGTTIFTQSLHNGDRFPQAASFR